MHRLPAGIPTLLQAFVVDVATARRAASGKGKKAKGAAGAAVARDSAAPVVKADARAFDPDCPAGDYAVDLSMPSGRVPISAMPQSSREFVSRSSHMSV
jgi:hypothetical protein